MQPAENPKVDVFLKQLQYLQKTQYSSIENIAEGGMGNILRVYDERLQRHIALKVVKVGNDEEAEENIARFIQEARITAQLEHPNIMPVHELGMDDYGNIYFAMKEIKGESMEDLLRNITRFPEMRPPLSHLLDIFLKILDALSFAHSKGVIHRDLKPGNIMLGAHGEVLVLDWGIAISKQEKGKEKNVTIEERNAQLANRGHIPFQTMAGCVLGTPEYMPPEQAMGLREEIDEQSDIYSIGIIMYQMLTTHLPFVAADPLDVLDLVVNVKPLSPKELLEKKRSEGKSPSRYKRRDVPEALDRIVMKCIEKRKEDRVKTAKDLKKEILGFLDANTQRDVTRSSPNLPQIEIPPKESKKETALEPVVKTVPMPSEILPEKKVPASLEPLLAKEKVSTAQLKKELERQTLVPLVQPKSYYKSMNALFLFFAGILLMGVSGYFLVWHPFKKKADLQQNALLEASFWLEKGEYEKVLTSLASIQLRIQSPLFLYNQIKAEIGLGKISEALEHLNQLQGLSQETLNMLDQAWVFFQIAEIHRNIFRNAQEAINYYLKATQVSPKSRYGRIATIYVALEQNKVPIAKTLIQEELQKSETTWELFLLQAKIAEKDQRWAQQKNYLEKCLALAPLQSEPYYELARCSQKLGEGEASLFFFERACQLSQNHPYYLLATGEHLYQLGEKTKADAYFKKALASAQGEAKKQIQLQINHIQESH